MMKNQGDHREEAQKRAAVIGIIAWCIVMLFAIASFLPADVLGAEPEQEYEIVAGQRDGGELNDLQRALLAKFNPMLHKHKSYLVTTYGQPNGADMIEVCPPDKACVTATRYLYLLQDIPNHVIVFVLDERDMVAGWLIRALHPAEQALVEEEFENPFKGTFK